MWLIVNYAPRSVQGCGWQTQYVLFARAGFSDALQQEAQQSGVRLVSLAQLKQALRST